MTSLTRFKRFYVSVLATIVGLALLSCVRNAPPKDYLARVEDTYLTMEDLKFLSILNPDGKVPDAQLQSFINNWIDTQMLSQQALKQDMDKDPYLKSRLENFYRHLLADTYARYDIYKNIAVSDQEIQDYYDQHHQVFLWEHDAAEVVHYFTSSQDTAREIYNILRNGTPEEKTVLYQKNQPESKIVTYQDVIPELGDVIFNTRAQGVLNIIHSDFGYHVVVVKQRFNAGTYQDINQVRDEIRERLIVSKQKKYYYQVLDSLKGVMDVEVNQETFNKVSSADSPFDTN